MKCVIQLILVLGLLLFCSCEEQTTWQLNSSKPFIVVDAIITSEFKVQNISIYSSSPQLNQPPAPIDNATVTLSDGKKHYPFKSVGKLGLYASEPMAAVINKTYTLVVQYNQQKDSAIANMIAVTPFKNDTILSKDGLYKFVYGGSDAPAMTEVSYDWSEIPDYCTTFGSCNAANTYYTINSIDVVDEFGPAKQEIWFPKGTTIRRKKYSLSNEHADFVRSLLIETQWRGGLFDVEPGNVPTNFRDGLRGWFGVCTVISDSVKVN